MSCHTQSPQQIKKILNCTKVKNEPQHNTEYMTTVLALMPNKFSAQLPR